MQSIWCYGRIVCGLCFSCGMSWLSCEYDLSLADENFCRSLPRREKQTASLRFDRGFRGAIEHGNRKHQEGGEGEEAGVGKFQPINQQHAAKGIDGA